MNLEKLKKARPAEPKTFGMDNLDIKNRKFRINTNHIIFHGPYARVGNHFFLDASMVADPENKVWFVFSISKAMLSPYTIASDGEEYFDLSMVTYANRGTTYDKSGDVWLPREYKIRSTKRKTQPNLLDKMIIQGFIRNEFGEGDKIRLVG